MNSSESTVARLIMSNPRKPNNQQEMLAKLIEQTNKLKQLSSNPQEKMQQQMALHAQKYRNLAKENLANGNREGAKANLARAKFYENKLAKKELFQVGVKKQISQNEEVIVKAVKNPNATAAKTLQEQLDKLMQASKKPLPETPKAAASKPLPEVPKAPASKPLPQVPKAAASKPLPQVPKAAASKPLPEVPKAAASKPLPQVPKAAVSKPLPQVPKAAVSKPLPETPKATASKPLPQMPKTAPKVFAKNSMLKNMQKTYQDLKYKAEAAQLERDAQSINRLAAKLAEPMTPKQSERHMQSSFKKVERIEKNVNAIEKRAQEKCAKAFKRFEGGDFEQKQGKFMDQLARGSSLSSKDQAAADKLLNDMMAEIPRPRRP